MMSLNVELDALLNAPTPERYIQRWLEAHPIAFGAKSALISQAPLGNQYQVDFMLVENITVGFTWTLIELKSADCQLFRADGLPTDALNSAIHQVELYQAWLFENVAYARTVYPEISQPRGRLIIGRRASLSTNDKRLLRQMNLRRDIEVMTYDRLIDAVRYTSNLEITAHNLCIKEYCEHLTPLANKICVNQHSTD